MPHVYDDFRAIASRIPDTVAVEFCHRTGIDQVTFGELAVMAEHAASTLSGLGLGAGDRCAILAENHYRWFVAYLGILRLGAVAVPLDTAYDVSQVRTVLRDSDAKAIVASSAVPRGRPRGRRRDGAAASRAPALRLGAGRHGPRAAGHGSAGAGPAGLSSH